jgi:putative glycosyltransferase (TIGR04348 family)
VGRFSHLPDPYVTSPTLSIGIVTPDPPSAVSGNEVTARRWAKLLGELGHLVTVQTAYAGEDYDLLISLHAMKSAPAIEAFHERFPERPQILALAGTDLYGDLESDPTALRSLELADRYVVLQPRGLNRLPEELRARAVTIHQSLSRIVRSEPDREGRFDVCVLSHLRHVKDPLLAAAAVRRLPSESLVRVTHVGAALEPQLGRNAKKETAGNPRYRWVGELEREAALEVLAASEILVLTSRTEGGANVVSEAIAAGVPVLSTRIEGSVGILGEEYPGYFAVGDAQGLADLLRRAETDPEFYADLRQRVERLAPLVDPVREREAWKRLLASLHPGR